MSPVVLGIDTSGSWCSAVLVRGDERFVRRAEVGNAHSARLLAMVDAVLADAGIALDACNAVAFAAGPGSFTGLRVGCAIAQGLAFGGSFPVAPIGTLDAIAHSLGAGVAGARSILVAQDARMGEVYWSLMEKRDERWHAMAEPGLCTPDVLRATLLDRAPIDIGCGNAWSLHGNVLDDLVLRIVVRESSDALDIAELGVVAAMEGRLVAAEEASPLYVRNDIARTTAERDAAARARIEAPTAVAG